MNPDAKLRMEVFQEGQRAARAGTPCPYTDWRANTWAKGLAAAKTHYRAQLEEAAWLEVVSAEQSPSKRKAND